MGLTSLVARASAKTRTQGPKLETAEFPTLLFPRVNFSSLGNVQSGKNSRPGRCGQRELRHSGGFPAGSFLRLCANLTTQLCFPYVSF